MTACLQCKAVLAFENDGEKLARNLEESFPGCECEAYSVGEGSPGRVLDEEYLFRAFTDPPDVDDHGQLARDAFRSAHQNGLSVFREQASDADVEAIISDILSVKTGKKPKQVLALFRVQAAAVRLTTEQRLDPPLNAFCIYDQTVPRLLQPQAPHVPIHAAIFFRHLKPADVSAKQLRRDCEGMLYKVISAVRVPVDQFRNGIITGLNARSLAGEFIRQ